MIWSQTTIALIFQLYGLSLFALCIVILAIPRKNLSFPFCQHAGWLMAFGLLHGLLGFIAAETMRNSIAFLPNIILVLLCSSLCSLMEFGRRVWNDTASENNYLRIPLVVYCIPAALVAYFFIEVDNYVNAIDGGVRLFIGVPASILAALGLLNHRKRLQDHPYKNLILPWLKITAAGLLAYSIFLPLVFNSIPEFPWYPTLNNFLNFTGMPVQLPRTLVAIIVTVGLVMLLRNSAKILVLESIKVSIKQANEEKYQTLFERTADAILTKGQDGFINCNQAALSLFAFEDKQAFLQQGLNDVFPDLSCRKQPQVISIEEYFNHASERGNERFEWQHRRQTGDLFITEVLLTPMTIDNEQVMQIIIRDISERKALEIEIDQHRDNLQELVNLQTRELRDAKNLAESANSAKSHFLSRMSHELRTPLNAIMGFSQMLELQSAPEETVARNESTNQINLASIHLLDLVNDLLDLSRIESGKLELTIKTLPLETVIQECISQLEPLSRNRNISVSCSVDSTLNVLADPVRLKQVILNLLSNAIKYNKTNGKIIIESHNIRPTMIRIKVSDTGTGIAADDMPHLFKSFSRLADTAESIEGTGIGLSLTKYMVEAMQGRIGVESALYKGSTFWFELPLDTSDEQILEQQESEREPISSAQVASILDRKYKVLYIEDDVACSQLVESILATKDDLAFLTTANAVDGLALAAEKKPDIILLDINLPGINGFEAVKKLKQNPATEKIPVIAVTANAMPDEVEKGNNSGFNDYIIKPFRIDQFLSVLYQNLPTAKEVINKKVSEF